MRSLCERRRHSASRHHGNAERTRVGTDRKPGSRQLRELPAGAHAQDVQSVPHIGGQAGDCAGIDNEQRVTRGIEREPPRVGAVIQRQGLQLSWCMGIRPAQVERGDRSVPCVGCEQVAAVAGDGRPARKLGSPVGDGFPKCQ